MSIRLLINKIDVSSDGAHKGQMVVVVAIQSRRGTRDESEENARSASVGPREGYSTQKTALRLCNQSAVIAF